MKDWKRDLLIVLAFFFSGLIIVGMINLYFNEANSNYKAGIEVGYKQACQDFYEGKLKYEPVFTQDGKVVDWIERKNNND